MASIAAAARLAGAQSLGSCGASTSYGTQPQANAVFMPALPVKQQAALAPLSQVPYLASIPRAHSPVCNLVMCLQMGNLSVKNQYS